LIYGSPPLSDAFGKRAGLTEHPHFSPLWGSVIRPLALMKYPIVTSDSRVRDSRAGGQCLRIMLTGVADNAYGGVIDKSNGTPTQHRNATTQHAVTKRNTQRRNATSQRNAIRNTKRNATLATQYEMKRNTQRLNKTRNEMKRLMKHATQYAIRNETQHETK